MCCTKKNIDAYQKTRGAAGKLRWSCSGKVPSSSHVRRRRIRRSDLTGPPAGQPIGGSAALRRRVQHLAASTSRRHDKMWRFSRKGDWVVEGFSVIIGILEGLNGNINLFFFFAGNFTSSLFHNHSTNTICLDASYKEARGRHNPTI